jgi:serine/threonine protein kinase
LSAAVLAIAGLVYFLMKYRGSYFAIRKEENAGRGELMRELYMEINEAEAFMTQDGGDASFAQDWIVKFSSLTVGDIIGSGASGQVYRGMYSGQDVAIKRIVVSQWDRSAFMTSFRREAAILSRLHHPNIVRFFGVSIRPEDRNNSATFFIITEFCPSSLGAMLVDHAHNRRQAERAFLGGGLQDLVGVAATGGAGSVGHGSSARSTRNDKDDVEAFFKSDRRRLMCVLEICRGVAFLHKKNVVHRDLKPDNVLIDGSGRAKLCDFGLSRLMTGPESSLEAQGGGGGGGAAARRMMMMTTAVGTPAYMAPELASTDATVATFSSAVDIYALGILANAVWSGDEPFTNEPDLPSNPFLLMERVHQGRRPRLGIGMKPELERLIQSCWHIDPSVRPLAPNINAKLEKMLTRGTFPLARSQSINPMGGTVSMAGVVTERPSSKSGVSLRGVELSGGFVSRARGLAGMPDVGEGGGGGGGGGVGGGGGGTGGTGEEGGGQEKKEGGPGR